MLKHLLFIIGITISSLGFAQKISTGQFSSFYICSDGSVQAWGSASNSQLGFTNYSSTQVKLPSTVSSLSGTIIAIASEEWHTLFLKNDGTVWACGNNSRGQLGVGNIMVGSTPVQVAITGSVTAIAAGAGHSLFLKSDGTVWACGNNEFGQLGTGNNLDSNTPVQVAITGSITAIAAGAGHSLFVKSDGYAWACGSNAAGQLGSILVPVGAATNTPVQVFTFPHVKKIDAGILHSVFLKSDGTVWTCGHNTSGQLGLSSNTHKAIPYPISAITGTITAIAAGATYNLFLKSDGTVWGCGDNSRGQLGNGDSYGSNTPFQLAITGSVTAIAASKASSNNPFLIRSIGHSMFLKSDGTVWTCGNNNDGQLGNGQSNVDYNNIPQQVQSLCQPLPTVAPTAVVNTPTTNAVCQGSDVNITTITYGSNPNQYIGIDNSINLNNPVAIDKNSHAVFVLNDSTQIISYDFNGNVISTYPNLSITGIKAFAVDENDNVYVHNGDVDGNGDVLFYRCDNTGSLVATIPSMYITTSENVTDMVYCTSSINTLNLFASCNSPGSPVVNGIDMNNSDPFGNTLNYNWMNKPVTSLTFDNFYNEKRLITADPVNNVLESQQLYNGLGVVTPFIDSALTAGMQLDFVSADTTFNMVSVSSRATGILGLAASYRNPDGSTGSYLDTTLSSKVNAVAPVGMVLVKKGNLLQYWVADHGQNKLLRVSLYSYQITPALPTGLVFNSISGIIEGTPTTVTAPQSYTLTIYSLLGSTSSTFTLGVTPAGGISNATGTSTSSANQADGKSVNYIDPNTCTKLAAITDFVGGTSPGYTEVSQTVNTGSLVTVGNKKLVRRVTTVKAQQTENLNASLTLEFTYQDVQAYNAANPTDALSNDTLIGSMQIATLHMHDTIIMGGIFGKKPILDSMVFALWMPATHVWQVGVHISQLSDFYIGPRSIARNFTCSNTGADTLMANDYYVWNYDTLYASGDYVDTLANYTGCDSIAKLHLTINITTGVSEAANGSGISVYPNPNNGLFNIRFGSNAIEPTRVRVLNVLGNEVYNKTHSTNTSIDLSGTENGVYFVIIDYKDKPMVWRIVKQD